MEVKIEATTAERLKQAMEQKGVKQADLAKTTGIDKGSISLYVSGKYSPKGDKLYKLAVALGVSSAWLSGFNVPMHDYPLNPPDISTDNIEFPVIGEVAAGFDNWAYEDWDGDKIKIPADYLKGKRRDDFFVLHVKGDSMYPMYLPGDKVLIHKQSTVDYNGQVAVVIYDDGFGTLKKVEYIKKGVKLTPINPVFQPVEITGTDTEQVFVIGVPKLLIRGFDEEENIIKL